jgi:hypothetical protein
MKIRNENEISAKSEMSSGGENHERGVMAAKWHGVSRKRMSNESEENNENIAVAKWRWQPAAISQQKRSIMLQ